MSQHVEQALLAFASALWSDAEIARATGGRAWRDMEREIHKRISILRHPAGYQLVAELADGVPPALVSQLEKLERALLRECATCQRNVLPPAGPVGGRPRKYCSDACRQAAYRARREPANQGLAAPPQGTSEN
ncbi:hypothetical protein ACFU7Z_13945 [Kitasatospora sp. NPDC057518]|uniref:hypothetical protein n=1 Tax=Kitasatospora TaxID=2063 RepID=UPI0011C3DB58|nr:hypothetical protein [Kitasatospora xanthocidica]